MRILALNHTFVRDIDQELEKRRLERLRSYAAPGTIIEPDYPEDLGGGEVLHHLRKTKTLSGLHHILGTPALVKKIIEAERAGYDAVVQIDAFDPGVEAARLAVRIPVVGLLRASCHFAATLCERFAITVPIESYIPYVWRMVETYRMAHFVSGIRVIDLFEVGDLSKYHDAILQRTIASCARVNRRRRPGAGATRNASDPGGGRSRGGGERSRRARDQYPGCRNTFC